jgi:hypothetical protein
MTDFLERLLGMARVRFENGKLLLITLGEKNQEFLPVTGEQFRRVPRKGPPEPVASVALLAPNAEGQFIEFNPGSTMKNIPAWFAVSEIVLTVWVVLAIASIIIYAPFWIFGGLSKKRRRPAERALRIWPLVAVLSLVAVVVLFMLGSEDLITHFGNLTGWSAAFFLATVLYAVASLASAVASWRAPRQAVRRGVRWHSIAVSLGLLIAAAYFAYWGMIGIRTWA